MLQLQGLGRAGTGQPVSARHGHASLAGKRDAWMAAAFSVKADPVKAPHAPQTPGRRPGRGRGWGAHGYPAWPSHICPGAAQRDGPGCRLARGMSGSHPLAARGSGQCDLGGHFPLHELSFLLQKSQQNQLQPLLTPQDGGEFELVN